MNNSVALWAISLLVLCLAWAGIVGVAFSEPATLSFYVGEATGIVLALWAPTGLLGLIAYAVKRNTRFAMWVWTISLLVVLALLSIGARWIAINVPPLRL